MQRTIEFVVVFWGAKYREFFTRFCLSSLLAPNNLPAFSSPKANGVRAKLIICSTQADYHALCEEPLFGLLAPHVEIEFIDIGWPPAEGHPILHMSRGHKLALRRIIERGSYASFLAPDIVLSDGSVATLIRHVSAGARTILLPALRFDLDKCVAGLSRLGALEPGKPLAVAPRELARIAVASLHSELQRFDYDADHFSDYPISTIFTDPGKGLIVHTSSWGLAAVDLSELKEFNEGHFDQDTIDAHFINDHISGLSDAVLLADSDEFFMLPLTSEEDMPQTHLLKPDPYLAGQPREVADQRKITYIRGFLFCAASDEFKRRAARQAVRIHYADLSAEDDPVARRAFSIIDTALKVKELRRPIYFLVVVRGEKLRSLFLTFCLPSLLSPRNAPELAGIAGCRLLVATTKEDWDELARDWLFNWLQSFVAVELIDIANFGADDLDQLVSEAQKQAVLRSMQDAAHVSFLAPDQILSGGTIARLMELASEGYDAVLAMAPQYDLQVVRKSLRACGYLLPHRPIDVSARDLTRQSMSAIRLCRCDWDGPVLPDPPVSFYVEAPAGVVMHGARWAVLLGTFGWGDHALSHAADAVTVNIDRELCRCHAAGRMYLVTDSDDINLISLRPERDFPVISVPGRYRRGPSWVGEVGRLTHLARYFESEQNNDWVPILYGVAVRYHLQDLTPLWRLVEQRALAIVRNALDSSAPLLADSMAALEEAAPLGHGRAGGVQSVQSLSGFRADRVVDRINTLAHHIEYTVYRVDGSRHLAAIRALKRLWIQDRPLLASSIKRAVKHPRWAIRRVRALLNGTDLRFH